MGSNTRNGLAWVVFSRCGLAAALLAGGASNGCTRREAEEKPGASGKVGEGETPKPGAEGTARRGGHVVLPSNEPTYLNPVLETRSNRANLLVFEGLVGLSGSLEPVPVLAESWEQSPDGKKITFRLRKGVKWQDGKPFTSKDVAFTFRSIRETPASSLWKAYFTAASELTTPDDNTVVVTYARPYAPALIAWTVGILPAHVYGGGALTDSRGNREPVGTGPYRMARWTPGKLILFEANEAWWHGRANLDRIELRLDVDDQLKALADKQLDFASVPDIGSWSSEAQLPAFRADFESATSVGSLFRAIGWNVQRAPFDDKRVRHALTLALNRGRVIEDVFLSQAQPMSGPFFPNMFGADPAIAPLPFDLKKAATELDEAGKPAAATGARFPLHIISVQSQQTPPNEEMFAIFRRDLASIGVELKVEYLTPKDYEARVVLRDFDAVFFGWFPDIPDPDPSALLHSTQIKVGQNFAGYTNAEADQLLEAGVATAVREERKALYHKLHAKVNEDLPYTVLYAPYSHFAWSRRLHGVSPEDVGAQARFPGIAGWWVDR